MLFIYSRTYVIGIDEINILYKCEDGQDTRKWYEGPGISELGRGGRNGRRSQWPGMGKNGPLFNRHSLAPNTWKSGS